MFKGKRNFRTTFNEPKKRNPFDQAKEELRQLSTPRSIEGNQPSEKMPSIRNKIKTKFN